jgi:membrane protein required for beta-lactamase induction
MRFSLVGFFVGAIAALVLYAVGTALFHFRLDDLIFGLAALLLWAYLALWWPGDRARGPAV